MSIRTESSWSFGYVSAIELQETSDNWKETASQASHPLAENACATCQRAVGGKHKGNRGRTHRQTWKKTDYLVVTSKKYEILTKCDEGRHGLHGDPGER